jgi:hypothetical protein
MAAFPQNVHYCLMHLQKKRRMQTWSARALALLPPMTIT